MRISEHIHAIKIPFSIPLPSGQRLPRTVYAYLVIGSKIALIDSGVAGSEPIISAYLRDLDDRPVKIDQLIFTHSHPDHIGAACSIRQQHLCSTAAHAEARAWIEDTDLQFSQRPVPGFHDLVEGPVPINLLLEDHAFLDLGDLSLQVLHTPGHSRDSISLFCPEEGVLFSGDSVPHPQDLPIYEDLNDSVRSIRKLRQIRNIRFLLSSWSHPAPQDDPYRPLGEGLRHLQRIHELVLSIAGREGSCDLMDLCRSMVQRLGLPAAAVNPLVARSFAAHLPLRDTKTL